MKINIKNNNDYEIKMTVELSWDDIKDDYNSQVNKELSNAKVKGARKGRLRGLQKELWLKNNKDYINSSFVDFALNKYFQNALQEKNIVPINQGQVSKLDFSGENSKFGFVIAFEIRPDINNKIPDYSKKVNIKTNRYIATDKDVNKAIEDIRFKHATMKSLNKSSKLKSGHFIHADFTKLDDKGNPILDSTLPNHQIKIGEGLFVGELEKPFINKKIGDIVNIKIDQESREVPYSVKINKIEEQILPELTDKFVKMVDKNFKNIGDFKEKINDNIQFNLDNENKKEFQNKVIEYFIDKTKFSPPKSMVENYKSYLIEDYKSKNQGSYDEEKMNSEFSEISTKNIKWLLVREFLMEKEKVFLKDSEGDSQIEKSIKDSPNYKKDIIKFYNDQSNRDKLKEDMLNNKFFSKLENYFINKTKEIPTDKIKKS